jgi:hypothetical protein
VYHSRIVCKNFKMFNKTGAMHAARWISVFRIVLEAVITPRSLWFVFLALVAFALATPKAEPQFYSGLYGGYAGLGYSSLGYGYAAPYAYGSLGYGYY